MVPPPLANQPSPPLGRAARVSVSDAFRPPQLPYQGKRNGCHPVRRDDPDAPNWSGPRLGAPYCRGAHCAPLRSRAQLPTSQGQTTRFLPVRDMRKKQERPDFRPAAPAIKGRIESRKQEHVGGSYAFHVYYNKLEL